MTTGWKRSFWMALSAAGMLVLADLGADAATKAPNAAGEGAASSPIQILPGTSSKEPISIDADKLVYFDKEKKAIYSGNVVVVQGDTKMTCSAMTVFLDRSPTPGTGLPGSRGGGPSPGSGLTRLEATGPVTVISKSQVATGDTAVYDKLENKVQLIGHVTLSDGQNTTKGDRLTYDLKTSQAMIDTFGAKSGRVHGQFLPKAGAGPMKSK
jgi:lipopolysaccharide export system protein LptA